MKKTYLPLCMLCIVSMLLCCSCGFLGDQKYECEVTEVESIQIVRLDEYIEGECRFEYAILAEITDHATFINKLNNLKHSVNWGDPTHMELEYVVIKIVYHNGDFDLIHQKAQWFNRDGRNRSGFFFFDQNQFLALISEYVTE